MTNNIKKLNGTQKEIMLEYIDLISKNKDANEFLNKKINEIIGIVKREDNKYTEDTNKKLTYVRESLSKQLKENDCDEKLKVILEHQELIGELENK
jgi:hypothetical protein